MGGVTLFLLLIVIIAALVLFFPGLGVFWTLAAKRTKVTSDAELGTGTPAPGERPLHRGPVPEQEEREKGTNFPPS